MRFSKPRAVRIILFGALVAGVAVAAIDYMWYRLRDRRATAAVAELDGRAASLLGWPWGKERIITFERPLTAAELDRLSTLNTLSGRDAITVSFRCDLPPDELDAARRQLPGCRVVLVVAADRN